MHGCCCGMLLNIAQPSFFEVCLQERQGRVQCPARASPAGRTMTRKTIRRTKRKEKEEKTEMDLLIWRRRRRSLERTFGTCDMHCCDLFPSSRTCSNRKLSHKKKQTLSSELNGAQRCVSFFSLYPQIIILGADFWNCRMNERCIGIHSIHRDSSLGYITLCTRLRPLNQTLRMNCSSIL